MSSSLIDQIFEDMDAGKIKPSSALKLRNEKAQSRIQLKRLPRIKRALKLREKILVIMDLALDFDPGTGEANEQWNEDNKWRPPISATSAALIVKRMAEKSEITKKALMRRSGVDEWNTSDYTVFTKEDWKVFRLYRFPRIMTVPVVSISDPRITGNQYANDYAIEVDRDPVTNQVIGEWPVALKVHKLYRDIAYEHRVNIEDCIEKAKAGEPYELKTNIPFFKTAPDLANILEKDFKDNIKKVYDEIIISEDRPSNYMVVMAMLLENDLTLKDSEMYKTITAEEVKKLYHTTKKTSEFDEPFANFTNGTSNKHDIHWDFLELDMICPVTVDDPNDAMAIGKGTRYAIADSKLKDEAFYDKFVTAVRQALDESQDMESQFMYSVYIRKFDETIEKKLLAAVDANKELENTFMTEKVLESNSDILSLIYGGEEVMNLITAAEHGMSDKDAGSLDEAKAATEAKLNLEEVMNGTAGQTLDATDGIEEIKPETLNLDAEVIELSE
jgi:hypothetical protein